MDLLPGPVLYPLISRSFCASSMLQLSLWLCGVDNEISLAVCFLSKSALASLWSSVFLHEFQDCFSSSVNNVFGFLLRIAVPVRINFDSTAIS